MRPVAIIGGGIVGLSVARSLLLDHGIKPLVLEAEPQLAAHQSGHNSGVIHSGLYYAPGSRKARDCAAGREALYRLCVDEGIEHERCGKLVVAVTEDELPRLDELARRGRANGLDGLRRVDAAGVGEHEPHVQGLAGLWVPQTGIVDFTAVVKALARGLWQGGAEIRVASPARRVERRGDGFVVQLDDGSVEARGLIACAGLQADRVARLCGLDPQLRIVPFRGEYFRLVDDRAHLVRNLVYPVPDPSLPFLGVHFTRKPSGGVQVGPNAVLAWSRGGYRLGSVSLGDAFATLTYPGFWRLVARLWRTGAAEWRRSVSRGAFLRDARRLVPQLRADDLVRDGLGIRAQAVTREGSLVDDFRILEADGMLHVLNAPSPAATASLAIGRHVAGLAVQRFGA